MNLENLQLTELSINEAREIDGGGVQIGYPVPYYPAPSYDLLLLLLLLSGAGSCYNPCPCPKK
ncbi:hypothetical protein [Flavobacterium hercynium]|uniref:Uncharacterized protein n=1 Tax=Flavobacterium hercynium TaxID=387094 RepID=A0A226GRQ4_9FLAO|nr:hypothetical protein [Flavobacterium hercynium]OXA84076.1 hypothetical protein B0A66_21565 [Flavobacterium hercynium]SMP37048.1 hypothetical protein SAMN06265346_1266 [Flavobacterium hercynium]